MLTIEETAKLWEETTCETCPFLVQYLGNGEFFMNAECRRFPVSRVFEKGRISEFHHPGSGQNACAEHPKIKAMIDQLAPMPTDY